MIISYAGNMRAKPLDELMRREQQRGLGALALDEPVSQVADRAHGDQDLKRGIKRSRALDALCERARRLLNSEQRPRKLSLGSLVTAAHHPLAATPHVGGAERNV